MQADHRIDRRTIVEFKQFRAPKAKNLPWAELMRPCKIVGI